MTDRPTLASHVAARLHAVGGKLVLVLHDTRWQRTAAVGLREWAVLGCADGTRDTVGIAAAAGVAGCAVTAPQVEALMDDLGAAGMLEQGVPSAPGPVWRAADGMPLVPLPGYALHCDGTGSCCRIYPTTVLSPVEASRAAVLLPEALRLFGAAGAFTPERGSAAVPWRARAIGAVDGCCALLDGAGRCALQLRGGAETKPLGCRLFPASLCDDGRAVRVSARPECACVLASARGGMEGEPLLPKAWQRAGDLPAGVVVERLADPVPITGQLAIPLGSYRRWCDAVAARLDEADGELDAAGFCWALARQLEGAGQRDGGEGAAERVAAAAQRATGGSPWVQLEALAQALGPVGAELDGVAAARGWRAPSDLARSVVVALAGACRRLRAEGVLAVADAPAERAYLRLTAHGHLWARPDEPPLSEALRRRALRILLARVLPSSATGALGDDTALAEPLALVEAIARSVERL